MKHVSAIIIKFIMTAIILEILLMWLAKLSFLYILGISAIITIVSYLIGDLWVLAKTNNIMATIVDVILAFAVIVIIDYTHIVSLIVPQVALFFQLSRKIVSHTQYQCQ
jgi:hypothetical protein